MIFCEILLRKYSTLFVVTLFAVYSGCSGPAIELGTEQGYLLIVGGGERPVRVMSQMVDYASRFGSGKIVVIPNASATPLTTGPGQAAEIGALSDKDVSWFNVTKENANEDSTLRYFDDVGGVWFSGGSQVRLSNVLNGTKLLDRIKEIYRDGGIIGGTSAGAAVMSELMINGAENRPVREGEPYLSIEGNNIGTSKGFNLIKGVIIDQHFVKRQRENRLISLVIENPEFIGIGIDEQTAILRKPDNTIEVFGNSNVLIFDATSSTFTPFDSTRSYALSASNMKFHVLTEGQVFDLKTLKVRN